MNAKHFLSILSLSFLTSMPLQLATAAEQSLLTALLRFTGISATPNTRAGSVTLQGDIWRVEVGVTKADEAQKITTGGNYHTPLWIPDSSDLIAMKGTALVQLNSQGNTEKTLHTLSVATELLGFDKTDKNRVLARQQSLIGILSLTEGTFTTDSQLSKNRDAVDRLNDDFRDYGDTQVFSDHQGIVDRQGRITQTSTIILTRAGKDISINCLSDCGQPALAENGRQLLFIGR